jgi:Domain of unknown function (DUF4384)
MRKVLSTLSFVVFFAISFAQIAGQAMVQVGVNKDQAGAGNASYAIGEGLSVTVATNFDAHIYLFNVQANQQITQLVPSASEPNNFISAGSVRAFPSNASQHYNVEGPAGVDNIIALASATPLDAYTLNQIMSVGQLGAQYHSSSAGSQDMLVMDSVAFNIQGGNVAQAAAGAGNVNWTQGGSGVLEGLQIGAPMQALGFSPRHTQNSIDGSFESNAALQDIVNHFGNELLKHGYQFEGAQGGSGNTFQGSFVLNNQKVMLTVQQQGVYYRFEVYSLN